MIHVDLKPEPSDFDAKVRIPGNRFLAYNPSPKNKDWSKHSYWTRCSDQLYISYGGICAYTGEWFSKASSPVSVDHFYPKSQHQELAYEWSNYRLTTQRMNGYKGDKIILDPFAVENGVLIMDVTSCLIKPSISLTPAIKSKASFTIKILHLNDEDLVNIRFEILMDYVHGDINRVFLARRYPFIESELRRQNLLDTIGGRIKSLSL